MQRTTIALLAGALMSVFGLQAPAQAAAPSNDSFTHPTVISSFPGSRTGSTVNATRASDDPECGADATIWFSYEPTRSRTIVVSTSGSSFFTNLGAYVGSRGSLTELACNNAGFNDQAAVQIHVTAGKRYYFMVDGAFEGERGSVQLSLGPPPKLSVAIARRGTVDQEGIVTLHGTYSCDQPGVVFFNATGSQGESSSRLSESFLNCPAASEPFEFGFATALGTPITAGRLRLQYDGHFHPEVGGLAEVRGAKTICLRQLDTPE